MFNVGGPEVLVILLVALIVLGPAQLPKAARQVGQVMAEIRKVSTGFQRELSSALQAEETAAELRAHCAQHLASFKVPEYVEFRDEPLPRNPAGKIQKQELRARFGADRDDSWPARISPAK